MATVSHEGTSRHQSSCSNPHEAGASYSRLVPKKIIMSLGRPFFSPFVFFVFFFLLPPPSLAIKYIGQLEMEESLFKNNVFFFSINTSPRRAIHPLLHNPRGSRQSHPPVPTSAPVALPAYLTNHGRSLPSQSLHEPGEANAANEATESEASFYLGLREWPG